MVVINKLHAEECGAHACTIFTVRGPDRRWRVDRAACVDAGCAKPKHHHAPGGRTPRACHAPDAASADERHHRTGPTPDCQQASGNKPQARRCNGRLGLCPMCEGCNRRCSAGRPQHDAKIETQPRLARHGKFNGLTDSPEHVTSGNAAGVAFVNRRPQRG